MLKSLAIKTLDLLKAIFAPEYPNPRQVQQHQFISELRRDYLMVQFDLQVAEHNRDQALTLVEQLFYLLDEYQPDFDKDSEEGDIAVYDTLRRYRQQAYRLGAFKGQHSLATDRPLPLDLMEKPIQLEIPMGQPEQFSGEQTVRLAHWGLGK